MLRSLAELGYVDGESVTLEFRFAERALERLPALAAELVAARPEVLYTFSSAGAHAAAAATSTIPIVVAPVSEETMAALVPDLAHPPGNITGLTLGSHEQREKCLQLLKEAAPDVTRVGVLLNPLNPVWHNYPEVLAQAAQVSVSPWFGWTPATWEKSNRRSMPRRPRGSMDCSGWAIPRSAARPPGSSDRGIDPAAPSALGLGRDGLCPARRTPFARSGLRRHRRRAAEYIDRILQGAKVAELPVEHPAEYKLIVNLKTAQELGIKISPSILLRADEVIE